MGLEIRKAVANDYDAICNLLDEVDALHRENLPDIFKKPNGPSREHDYFLGVIRDEDVGLFVAELEGALVGTVHAIVRETLAIPMFVPRRYVVVESIVVEPRYRAKGIGRKLMETTHEWAMAKGAIAIELNVYEFNQQAINFYSMLGYAIVSRRMSRSLDSR